MVRHSPTMLRCRCESGGTAGEGAGDSSEGDGG